MKAVILLSGGLDSSTVLYQAKADGCECYPISFDYKQRHRRELESARAIALSAGVKAHQIVNFDLTLWGGSALTDNQMELPIDRTLTEMSQNIPITYVPARNTIFLSFCPRLRRNSRSSANLHRRQRFRLFRLSRLSPRLYPSNAGSISVRNKAGKGRRNY